MAHPPLATPVPPLWIWLYAPGMRIPAALKIPPKLDNAFRPHGITRRHALLINPFYPKDPHASFGKHVLTPTLALTSIAAATPPQWTVAYWDENLLQGPPPHNPFPEVVGISVHLTFANRAFELARWYRDRGAKVVAAALRDAGMEVIYTGLHQTPEQIVETVIQEDADAVGLSILSGAHMTLVPRVVELLREQGIDDVLVTVGGTIPSDDIPELKQLGVAEVFTPGAPPQAIIDFIQGAVPQS